MRVLELFCGVGGWRYATGAFGEVVAAYDISPAACETYAQNHGDRPRARELAALPARTLLDHGADLWAMSPPCQPFCRMGHRKGLEDPRSRAFLRVMEIFRESPPRALLLENVQGFQGSEAHEGLLAGLRECGFQFQEFLLCPTAFGIPNQRPRYYLAASRAAGLRPEASPLDRPAEALPLSFYLDPREDEACYLSAETLSRHAPGMDFVTDQDRRSTCFIGGYGQRYVGSGSFLVTPRGVRRFSPCEIARLMGLPEAFRFPESVSREQRYKLLGNGLSIPVATWVARSLVP